MAKNDDKNTDAAAAEQDAFNALVSAKMAAGLPRKQAEEVAKSQLAHDKALAEAAGKGGK